MPDPAPVAAGAPDAVGLRYRPWLHRYAMLLALCVFVLIGVGGTVTSTGAGMAVPDWPTTFGHNMVTAPPSVWFHQADRFWEHFHRLVGTLVGMLTIGLAVWLTLVHAARPWRIIATWSVAFVLIFWGAVNGLLVLVTLGTVAVGAGLWLTFRHAGRAWLVALSWGLLLMVIVQGLMGGLRVTEASIALAVLHGIFGQVVFGTCVLIAAATSRVWRDAVIGPRAYGERPEPGKLFGMRYLAALLLVLLVIQLALGAWVRHNNAGLAIPDFPTAYGQLLPPLYASGLEQTMDQWQLEHGVTLPRPYSTAQVSIHLSHRAGAVAVCALALVVVVWLNVVAPGHRLTAWPARTLVALLALQVALGAYVIWSRRHVDIATAHQACGALVLATATLLTIRLNLLRFVGLPERVGRVTAVGDGGEERGRSGGRSGASAAPQPSA